jgi:hypothetical protein
MNLSKRSGDKELFSGTIVEENTSITTITISLILLEITISLILLEILFKINVLLIQFLILKTSVLNSFSPF